MNHIYIVFSATPYFIGRAIRKVTKQRYNHVSIALDPELNQMYSFARRFYRTPLYGGYVKESHARYHVGGKASQICICKIPVTQDQYIAIENKLHAMYADADTYMYNLFSALGAIFHKQFPVEKAYTCVEFCVEILCALGMNVDPGKYYSVCDLKTLLSEYIICSGPMPADETGDPDYFAKNPIPFPTWVTIKEICKLIPRLNKKTADE